jgi:membrane-bound serine protease (ClpP class)
LVVSSKATIGDIGQGEKTIGAGMFTEYSDLARRRKPAHQAVILGMLKKELRVWKVVTARDTRYVLDEDLKKLEETEQIRSKDVLIEAGQLGNFTGEQLRQMGLAQLTADTRPEVAELYKLPAKVAVEDARFGVDWKPVRIRVTGEITLLTKEYVVRHIKESMERGKNLFILEIDSFGGHGGPGLDLGEFLKDLKGARTIAYIPERAISAAAFIALGCDEIIMHPDAKLGDCGVMFMDPNGQFHYAEEKEISYFSSTLETIAKAKGYSPTLARAMIEKDLVVKEVLDRRTGRISYMSEQELEGVGRENLEVRRVVKDKDNFLTLNGEQAQGLQLAGDLVDSYEGLKTVCGLEDIDVMEVTPTWVDTLIWVLNLPVVSVILIIGGILGLYLELKLPGAMLPGVVAVVCFLLFFWSHVMGGTATTLEIVLFLGGLLLLGVEILVIPGFGVVGFTGIIMMIIAIVLASQTFVLPQGSHEWNSLAWNIFSIIIAFGSLFVFAILAGRYLPDVPLLGRVVLRPGLAVAGTDAAIAFDESPYRNLQGQEGVAMTTLRPAGRVRFGDQYVDVVTQGDYIDAGLRVRVIEVTGNRVVVKQA